MGKLSDSDRRRLASLVNLTSSQHDGEALNALRAATRISANAGLTLTEALQAGASAAIDVARIQTLEADAFERGREQGVKDERSREKRQRRQEVVAAATSPPAPQGPSWQTMRQRCLAEVPNLGSREMDFLNHIAHWHGRLTDRQENWLLAIFDRRSVKP